MGPRTVPGAGGRRGVAPPPLALRAFLLALLALQVSSAVEVGDTWVQLNFFQESFPSGEAGGQFLFAFDKEEVLQVDWAQKRTVWRLPDFEEITGFEARGGLENLAILKSNLQVTTQRSNRTQEQDVPPSATVYSEDPVELGNPNLLICFVDKFFPPVLNVTWMKNGQVVSQGVQETGFLPSTDYTFRMFSYLPFVPEEGDVYACRVDHWGLRESLTRLWYSREPTLVSETPENVVCGLGLAIGLSGIVVGSIIFFKATRMSHDRHHGSSARRGGL